MLYRRRLVVVQVPYSHYMHDQPPSYISIALTPVVCHYNAEKKVRLPVSHRLSPSDGQL